MNVPEHIAEVLGCPTGIDESGLRAYLDAAAEIELPWFLAGEEPKEALVAAIFNERSLHAHVLPQKLKNAKGLYYQATDGGVYSCSLVSFGNSANDEDGALAELPTTALIDLASAWPKFSALVQRETASGSGTEGDVNATEATWGRGIPSELVGKALILRSDDGSLSEEDHAGFHPVLTALAGLRMDLEDLEEVAAPKWTEYKIVDLRSGGLVRRPEMLSGKLLQEALAETRVRWRFISLYRVFESAYLLALADTFNTGFFANPKGALGKLKDALDSELNQFKEVVRSNDLQQHFEAIRLSASKLPNNTLNKAVMDELSGQKGSNKASWEVGVAIVYKLRCAIVHAGQRHVVFDRYSDGNDLLVELVGPLESAVLALLGLELR